MSAVDRFVVALGKTLNTRERDRSPVRILRVVDRARDGAPLTVRQDGVCVLRGSSSVDAYSGETIAELGSNGGGGAVARQGTSAVAPLETAADGATLWVERLDPSTFAPGHSYFVNVTGRGFTDTTTFEFLDEDGETINPDITINEIGILGPDAAALDIYVSPDARLQGPLPLAYGRDT